jgi:hypothetical protein
VLCPWVTVTTGVDGVTVKPPVATGALSIENVCDAELPPGAGLETTTSADPTVVKSAATIVAVNWVGLTKVVTRAAPFQRTVAPETKPLPFTVKTRLGEPAVVVIGEMLTIAGIPGYPTVIVPAT